MAARRRRRFEHAHPIRRDGRRPGRRTAGIASAVALTLAGILALTFQSGSGGPAPAPGRAAVPDWLGAAAAANHKPVDAKPEPGAPTLGPHGDLVPAAAPAYEEPPSDAALWRDLRPDPPSTLAG